MAEVTQVYYFYRYIGLNCKEIKFLGTFETSLDIMNIWDILFQVFCEDGSEGGMFVRKEKIELGGDYEL